MRAKKLRARTVLEKLRELNPTPRCELYHETPFQLLLSVMLSAQTTDKSVNHVMTPIYQAGFRPTDLVALGREGFLQKIKRIGLAPTKAKNAVALASILIADHNGSVPRTRPELEALPGVGRKTASVVLAELFGEPTLAVDTHVFRVTRRLRLHKQDHADRCEDELLRVIDREFLPAAHHWLILHGRYTCKARTPNCPRCPVANICPSFGKQALQTCST